MALNEIAARSFDFLTGLPGAPSAATAQAADTALLGGDEPLPAQLPFSAFRRDDLREAAALMSDLNGIIRDMPDENGIKLAFRRVRDEAAGGREAMARDVWASFVTLASTRLPELGSLRVPPVVFVDESDTARSFDLSLRAPSRRPAPLPHASSTVVVEGSEERPLDWFREDLFFAEHHRWWHVVYPSFEMPRLDRHGELFLYMHQQMLARYITERRLAGMPELQPRTDATAVVRWGYDPDARPPTVAYYTARDANQSPTGMAVTISGDDALDLQRSGECGSRSFCGKRDPKYPDRKPMGYPFDRDWAVPDGRPIDIAEGLGTWTNLAARRFTIVHDGLQELIDAIP